MAKFEDGIQLISLGILEIYVWFFRWLSIKMIFKNSKIELILKENTINVNLLVCEYNRNISIKNILKFNVMNEYYAKN